MSNYNNVNRVLIGDGANAGAITKISGIQKGDLFILNEAGAIVATNAAALALPKHERITIAAGIAAGQAILSSPIQGNTTSKYEGKAYVAPSERVVILGYNGTGSTGISVSAGEDYRLRVAVKDSNRPNGQRTTLAADVVYPADTGATAASVAAGVACMYYQKDFGTNYAEGKVKLERVSNGTRSAFPNTAAVELGSNIVTITAHVLTVGTPIRLDVAAHGVNSPVYIVSEVVDANTIKIDAPYQGATGTIALANSGSLATVTEWGFKLTGEPQSGLAGVDEYEWINFNAVFSAADAAISGAAVSTELTALNPGQGYYKQVRDREEAAKGYLGDTSKRRFDDNRIASVVVEGQAYDSVVISHANVIGGDMQDTYRAPLQTEIYIPDGSNQGLNSGNNFLHILNGFLGASNVGFANISF